MRCPIWVPIWLDITKNGFNISLMPSLLQNKFKNINIDAVFSKIWNRPFGHPRSPLGPQKGTFSTELTLKTFLGDSLGTFGYFDEKISWLTIFSQWFWKIPYLTDLGGQESGRTQQAKLEEQEHISTSWVTKIVFHRHNLSVFVHLLFIY